MAVAQTTEPPRYHPNRLLIQPNRNRTPAALAQFHTAHKTAVIRTFAALGGLQLISVPRGETVPDLVAKFQASGLVEFVEPDYAAEISSTTPNDPRYVDHTLWGLDRISAPAGWDVLTSASNIVVAVLDTGVRYTHEDLAANMWTNPNDGSYGLNAIAGTTDPADDMGHGTLVTGVLGAVGNNGKGVTGVAWNVKIMAGKCFDNLGHGFDSAIIACIEYACTNGARIINASWGVTNSLAVSNALASARDTGIIVVAACGNGGTNIDANPTYPTAFHLGNVVSVAATRTNDTLSTFSNYGATNVHLAAPGEQIYSTFAATDNFYLGNNAGTSFSAPYVTGALALLLAKYPTESYQQIITRLLAGTDPVPALAGKCVTGGRLNLRNALSPPIYLTPLSNSSSGPLTFRVSAGPNRTCIIQRTFDLDNWSPVETNTTSATGTFDYTDPLPPMAPPRFFRALSTL